jgi:hypothetical protein
MFEHLKVQLIAALNGVGGSMRTGIVVQLCDDFDSISRRLFKKLVSVPE